LVIKKKSATMHGNMNVKLDTVLSAGWQVRRHSKACIWVQTKGLQRFA